MLTQNKIDKFNAIARDLYAKEYFGVGKEIDNEITEIFSEYLQNVFYDIPMTKDINKMKDSSSNILKLIRTA
jgi:hypothetical protein